MEGRSQKDGSQVQVVLSSTDGGAMKPSFQKLRGIFSFLIFTLGTTSPSLLYRGDRVELLN